MWSSRISKDDCAPGVNLFISVFMEPVTLSQLTGEANTMIICLVYLWEMSGHVVSMDTSSRCPDHATEVPEVGVDLEVAGAIEFYIRSCFFYAILERIKDHSSVRIILMWTGVDG
ncbi:MAG: hypothetical protein PHY05_13485 [Methanothrix sp.]|nr:hypothetical protein [Methanothrix sp.]